eukprot:FR737955.1.p1 GENE.FR737955.1~~FR737955.1.p1  ORF type:complete len:188 (+),score=3.40 FR737955.1:261-824(+)
MQREQEMQQLRQMPDDLPSRLIEFVDEVLGNFDDMGAVGTKRPPTRTSAYGRELLTRRPKKRARRKSTAEVSRAVSDFLANGCWNNLLGDGDSALTPEFNGRLEQAAQGLGLSASALEPRPRPHRITPDPLIPQETRTTNGAAARKRGKNLEEALPSIAIAASPDSVCRPIEASSSRCESPAVVEGT